MMEILSSNFFFLCSSCAASEFYNHNALHGVRYDLKPLVLQVNNRPDTLTSLENLLDKYMFSKGNDGEIMHCPLKSERTRLASLVPEKLDYNKCVTELILPKINNTLITSTYFNFYMIFGSLSYESLSIVDFPSPHGAEFYGIKYSVFF